MSPIFADAYSPPTPIFWIINRAAFMGALSGYYIQARYPDQIESLSDAITPEMAGETLRQTEEVIEWLFSMRK